jgi:hypothetical protein
MYNSIIATDMFTLKGSNEIERMDDRQLADLGIERKGNTFLCYGKVVHEIPGFDVRTFVSLILKTTLARRLLSAKA